jgi:tetratricopeptide (TPR) repeat protein
MRYTERGLLLWLALTSVVLVGGPVSAQQNPHEQLQRALVLEEQGHFKEAIALAKSVTDLNLVTGVELGRGYIVLGFALRCDGRLTEAQTAFEHALRLLEKAPNNVTDYAAALDGYAALYSETGQPESAMPFWFKALHLREQINDHEGMMRSLTNLAGVAMGQRQVRRAKHYLKRASEEVKLATDLTDDDFAALAETQAWLAMLEGKPTIAVDGYRRALELCEHAHGEQHWLVGWEKVLRGRAYFQSGDMNAGLDDMRAGLAILDHVLGKKNPKYVVAEIAYAQMLDRAGARAEAARLRAAAEQKRRDFSRSQCVGCTIDISSFQ